MKSCKDARGFTLVEGLVVGLIAATVAVIFVPFMNMHNASLKDGVARGRLLIQSDVVSGDIARRVRTSSQVRPSDESWYPRPSLSVRTDLTHVVFYSSTGAVVRAYKFEGGYLKESEDNSAFQIFRTGNDTVRAAGGSGFKVSADRRELTVNLKLTLTYMGATYTAMTMGNMVVCRN